MNSQLSGTSQIEHLKAVERTTKFTPPELTDYRNTLLPTQMVGLWYDFLELSERRSYTESGPQTIGYQQLQAWAEINDVKINTFIQDTIFALDRIWLNVQHENRQKQMRK